MFEIKSKIENIKRYLLSEGELCFITKDYQIFFRENKSNLFNSPLNGCEIFDEKIFLSDWSANYKILDMDLNVLEAGNGKAFFKSSFNYLGLQFMDNNGNIVEALLCKSSQIMELGQITKQNNLNFSSENYYFYLDQQNNIATYSISTNQTLWKFNIDEIGSYYNDSNQEKKFEVRKFIGIWKNYLLILLSNNALLILDKNNGTFIKRIIKIPPQKMAEYTIDFLGNCMELDEQTGKLKGFVNFVFWELDLSNFNFECFNLANTVINNNLNSLMNITSYGQSDEHYFVTMFKIDDTGSMISYLVALNKESKNIDWANELPWTGVNVPQYANGKLYQLDNNNTLHIFERE